MYLFAYLLTSFPLIQRISDLTKTRLIVIRWINASSVLDTFADFFSVSTRQTRTLSCRVVYESSMYATMTKLSRTAEMMIELDKVLAFLRRCST